VTANSADYYNDFYNCIQADKTVASVSGCSTCNFFFKILNT